MIPSVALDPRLNNAECRPLIVQGRQADIFEDNFLQPLPFFW
jgi:hypothetical protein